MKLFFSLTLIIALAACKNGPEASIIQMPPENSITHTIKLIDSLGNVTIELPSRYDTSFLWTHYSDCGTPCDKIKYRFQPKFLPVKQESGWMWHEPKDSVEQFTISHSGYFPFRENTDSNFLIKYLEYQKGSITEELGDDKFVSDTLEKIGDRYFSIVAITLYDTIKSAYSKKLWAVTTIKGNTIDFKFEILTKEKDSLKGNFIKNAKYYLRTVRLSKGM